MKIALDKIVVNPQQPRTQFDQDELQVLADSLKNDGLLNPIAVEGPTEAGTYILLDGERRWRAAYLAGWTEIESNVARPSLNGSGELERLRLALVGNLQREDMGPIDEARAFKKLTELGLSYVEIARQVGKSHSHIGARLSMLNFPPSVQKLWNDRKLPLDIRVFSALGNLAWNEQESVAKICAAKKMGVYQILGICKRINKSTIVRGSGKLSKDPTCKPGPKAKYKLADSDCPPLEGIDLTTLYLVEVNAIKKTCAECGLYCEGGVRTICPTCPMIMFVKLLTKGNQL